MNYEVGQVLYVCNQNKLNIYPVQIVEEVVRTTLNGKERTYIVMLPDKERTCFDIQKIQDNLFASIDEVKQHMVSNATIAIENMGAAAEMLSAQSFNLDKKTVIQNDKHVQVENNNDIIMVDLGGGVKAKMNTNNLKEAVGQE